MHVTSRWFAFVLLLSSVAPLSAVDNMPSADSAKALQKKFEEERAAALAQKFPADSLELADKLAQRGKTALDGKAYREAMQYYHEARWQIPYLPANLPKGVSRVFGNTRMRHGDSVRQVAFNPDSTFLASASLDGTVKIWDLGNGREVRVYRRPELIRVLPTDPATATVAWSPDGKLIAFAGGDPNNSAPGQFDIHLFDPENGKLIHVLKGHTNRVNGMAFRNDSKTLVSCSDDKSIRIWDVEKGTEQQIVNPQLLTFTVNQVAYSPDDKLIASVNNNGQLQIWNPDAAPPKSKLMHGSEAHIGYGAYQVVFSPDMKSVFTCGGNKLARQQTLGGSKLKEFDAAGGGHNAPVTAMALSPDGKTLVTGSMDHSIRVWDLTTSRVVRTLQGHTEQIHSLAFSKDGTQLASASSDQTIRIWNLSSTDQHRSFGGHDGYVWSAVFSNDGKIFATAGADRKILIRDAASGEILQTIPAHALAITALAFNKDGSRLASSSGDSLVKLWNVKTGGLIKEFKGHNSAVMAVAFSHDDKHLMSGGVNKTVRWWDVDKGTLAQTFSDFHSPISSVAIRPDDQQALIGCADGSLHIYALGDEPKETGVVSAHLSGVSGLAYSPEGARAATCGGDKLIKIWKLADNGPPTMINELKGHAKPVLSVAFSNDGRLLASGGGDFIVKIWDVQNGTELRSLRGDTDWISSVVFGADSRFILSASLDKTVNIWELSNEETIAPTGHTKTLNTLAVSADGKLLASGSNDRTVKVWNIATGQQLYTLAEHSDPVKALAFDPDNQHLISGGDDSKLRTWDLKTRKVIRTRDCDGNVALIAFAAKGDRLNTWLIRPGLANSYTTTVEIMAKDGKLLHALSERDFVAGCLTFSSDAAWAAMGSPSGSVRIWDIAKNERVGGDMPAHQKKVIDLVFTPDKKLLITGDEDGEIKIWNIAKREAIKTIQAHQSGLLAIALSPNGKRFVTVDVNGEIKLWDVDKGEKIKQWELATPIRNLAFSADGKKLYTANGDTTLYQIDMP